MKNSSKPSIPPPRLTLKKSVITFDSSTLRTRLKTMKPISFLQSKKSFPNNSITNNHNCNLNNSNPVKRTLISHRRATNAISQLTLKTEFLLRFPFIICSLNSNNNTCNHNNNNSNSNWNRSATEINNIVHYSIYLNNLLIFSSTTSLR